MSLPSQPTQANRQRYIDAFKKVTVDSGTPYPCSEDDIKILTAEKPRFWRFEDNLFGRVMSVEEATVQLERALLPSNVMSSSTIDALERLREMLLLENADWGPDLLVKTCHDWDKVFFNGCLKGYVRIKWSSEESMLEEDPESIVPVGVCLDDKIGWRWGQCEITMNADYLLLFATSWPRMSEGEQPFSQFELIWGIFLHELCHAYLSVLTAFRDWGDDEDFHGEYFQRCLNAVEQSARRLLSVETNREYSDDEGRRPRYLDVKNPRGRAED